MTYEQIKAFLAPCGLSCEKCFAHVDGEIRQYSLKLKEKLGNFDIYAKRFETLLGDPVFKKYPDFKAMLDYFASENCRGCRNEQCKMFKNCGVRVCHQEKQIDYCYQCDEFPCNRTNFDENLHKAWVRINEIIKNEGLEKYYEKTSKRPRYILKNINRKRYGDSIIEFMKLNESAIHPGRFKASVNRIQNITKSSSRLEIERDFYG